ncbi:MAG: hypothetical protein ABS76_24540 [Pelagibacterium sp. SCN 64-44]|mgnify:CR=1 FL=1|nr:MAG: hypothetical protein ABS76_24540 [Pelagibacterium sp. SCN 64-44]
MKYTSRIFQIFFAMLALGGFSCTAWAEPVSVNRGIGLGYVFSHNQNCFLILPAHVHGRGSRVSISTAIPASVGDATLVRTYAPELDLSLFYVTSGLANRCKDRFSALPEEIGTLLDSATTAQLIRVDATGAETRDAMTIVAADFETIAATADDSEIYQGTSGAILRIGTTPIGMAIQSESIGQATFLRMDEIVARIRRSLTGTIVPAPAPPPDDETALVPAGACPVGSIAIRAVQCSVEPVEPHHACANLITQAGVTVFPAGTRPQIVVELGEGKPVPVGAVTLLAPDNPDWAKPQQIRIDFSSVSGAPRWLRFGAADMSPLGSLELRNGSRPFANRLAINLLGSWEPGLPSALACLAVD